MDSIKIGKYIARKRKELGMTQKQLGDILNVNDKTVSRWETGKYMPDLSLLIPLSKALGVTVYSLLNGADMTDVTDSLNESNQIDKTNTDFDIKNEEVKLAIEYADRKMKENNSLHLLLYIILFSIPFIIVYVFRNELSNEMFAMIFLRYFTVLIIVMLFLYRKSTGDKRLLLILSACTLALAGPGAFGMPLASDFVGTSYGYVPVFAMIAVTCPMLLCFTSLCCLIYLWKRIKQSENKIPYAVLFGILLIVSIYLFATTDGAARLCYALHGQWKIVLTEKMEIFNTDDGIFISGIPFYNRELEGMTSLNLKIIKILILRFAFMYGNG